MTFVEDLAPFLADFGQTATLAGASVTAIVDTASEVVQGDGLVTQGPTALLRTSESASAAPGQSFVASSVTYTVRQVLREAPDGVMTRLILARA